MNKKEKIVFYVSLCCAFLVHILLIVFFFFIKESQHSVPPSPNETAIVFDEQGEAGTPKGSPDGTEVVQEAYTPDMPDGAATGPQSAEAQETEPVSGEEIQESEAQEPGEQAPEPFDDTQSDQTETESSSSSQSTDYQPVTSQNAMPLLEPALTPSELPSIAQKRTPIDTVYTATTTARQKKRRAAWHNVNANARSRAVNLNIQQSLRGFNEQHYDAYGTQDGTGGSSDGGTGTGGGGNARYRANLNSLDIIRQSYQRKIVHAIVAQSHFMQIIVSTPYPTSKHFTWRLHIGENGKITRIEKEEGPHAHIDEAMTKIIYATQLPPLPSRLKDGLVFHARCHIEHAGQASPLILTTSNS